MGQPRRSGRATARKALRASRPREARRGGASGREREILDAAIAIFHERGYADTSVEDVATAVGLLKGSLYYYIDSKEDLLYRILEDVHESVRAIMDDVGARIDLDPLERLELYVREQVAYNVRHIKEISVYYHDIGQLTGEHLADLKRRRKRSEDWVAGLLEEAQERGQVDPELDTRLAANCTFAPIVWLYTWFQPGRGISAQALGDFCAEFVLHGLSGAGRSSAAARPQRAAAN